MTSAIDIHIGLKTHHQDQLMTWQSLSVIKTMVSRPENPMPPEDVAVFVLAIV